MGVLVTGGAGFIGSHVVHALLDAQVAVVVLDDLSAGNRRAIGGASLVVADIADADAVHRIVEEHRVEIVVHVAAVKSVPESVERPLLYYRENVAKTIALLEALDTSGARRVIFSSSAAVYADAGGAVVDETAPTVTSSPYARTKLVIENLLDDLGRTGRWQSLSLRYFNPIGADPGGRTGPTPATVSGTALGSLVAAHRSGRPFRLMGTDWPTPDGTAVRDYVHVQDVAEAHVAAVRHLLAGGVGTEGHHVVNIGSGRGTSLRELSAAFDAQVERPVSIVETARRPGDVAGGSASVALAAERLGWRPRLTVADGIRDVLRWVARTDDPAQDDPAPVSVSRAAP